jgi:phosphopantothenoylcysteine decarboxylase/phosphopantothenate--cysteine ligase
LSFGEHTSKNIIGTKGTELKDRKIVLCITGSVAAIKSPEIARELMRYGAEVYTIMSDMAQKIIHPYMMEWSTGNTVITDLTGKTEHVTLGGEHSYRADLILVAPCTANTIGKAASAIDDTPVTTLLTTAIGARIPVVIAPAMHDSMYHHPIVIDNIEKLRSIGIEVLMPRFEEGKAKIPSSNDIVNTVIRILSSQTDYKDLKVLITAGPTREYLDGFRFISNPSSGKMGVAIANEAINRGALVTMIYGPGTVKPPSVAKIVTVNTTEEMKNAVITELEKGSYDIAILAAAVADYGAKERKMIKTSSSLDNWNIELKSLPKIINQVKKVAPDVYLVGFKAEYNVSDEELVKRALKRMNDAEMDLIVANDVARENVGFGTDTNEVFIVSPDGVMDHISVLKKHEIAKLLLSQIRRRMDRL